MAKARLNPILLELHGKVGDMVFRRTPRGGVSLIRKADMSNVKWSPAQQANRQRFREAAALARRALSDPAQRKKYEKMAAGTGRRVIDVAISDHLQKLKKQ
jgi:hypothetical protein